MYTRAPKILKRSVQQPGINWMSISNLSREDEPLSLNRVDFQPSTKFHLYL